MVLVRLSLVITLGAEAVGFSQNESGAKKWNFYMNGALGRFKLTPIDPEYKIVHMAHPGIVIRPVCDTNQWLRLHREQHVDATVDTL